MNSINLILLFSYTLFLVNVSGAECPVQPVFETFPTLFCDGDGGGAQLTISPNIIELKIFGGPEPISELPGFNTPNNLKLEINRGSGGRLIKGSSKISVDGQTFSFGAGAQDKKMFRKWYNVLQVLVQNIEVGDCPIDNKAQKFPQLASVRGSLQGLASAFQVRDCEGIGFS